MAEAKKTVAKKAAKKPKAEVKPKELAIKEETKLEQQTAETNDKPTTASETEAKEELAKAGKRSAKAKREAEAEEAKEERKVSGEAEAVKPKSTAKPTRPKIERQGKGLRNNFKKIDHDKAYTLDEAIELAKTTSHVKFDATVELHVNLGVDPKQADQNIRDNLVLPAGSGKKVRVAVISDDSKAALAAGADIAGSDDFLQQLDKGKLDFDILIASPNQMAKLGKYARTLGPRGLMPNPKSGTVTNDIDRAVKEAKGGRVEYRVDSSGIIHLGIGKVSFTSTQLSENIAAVLASIKANKPSSIKSNYLKTIHLATTMGPSINVDVANVG